MSAHVTDDNRLAVFLRFADKVMDNHALVGRPAYSETCPCGGSVEVGRDVPRAERSRMYRQFVSRHLQCTRPATVEPQPRPNGFNVQGFDA